MPLTVARAWKPGAWDLNSLETEYGHQLWVKRAKAFAAPLNGAVRSSTRSGVSAGTLAALSDDPVVINTDSKGFCGIHRRACAYFAGMEVPHFA